MASDADVLAQMASDADPLAPNTKSITADEQETLVDVPESIVEHLLTVEAGQLARDLVEPVSMSEILDQQHPKRVANFMHREIPRRIAVRIRMIERLVGWKLVPELVQMSEVLHGWFRDIRLVRRGAGYGLGDFTVCVQKLRKEGRNTVRLAVVGLHKLRSINSDYTDEEVDKWLNDFLLLRMSITLLIDQYLAVVKPEDKPRGIVRHDCDATDICEKAAAAAAQLCQVYLGVRPNYKVETFIASAEGNRQESPYPFSYIPMYLRYVILEVLKNSFMATVKVTQEGTVGVENCPIHILVSSDEGHCAIRVRDRAGGMPHKVVTRIWSYLYGATSIGDPNAPPATPLSGYGVGLPLSRLQARHLGGDLTCASYPGYGTDMYLQMPSIGYKSLKAKSLP